ncbi:MAG: NAD(+)/NADH kinase [Bacteroidales bacterium]|nr:NAD(+)/NADH kinase [Bacteroidales bacterium]
MKIALYHRQIAADSQQHLDELIHILEEKGVETVEIDANSPSVEQQWKDCRPVDFLLSVGGDGTLLSSVHLIANSGVPVVGVNFGHLGFLTTVGRGNLAKFVDDLLEGNFTIEERALLHIEGTNMPPFALNEVSLHRREEVAMLRTNLYVDNEFVATYDGDGLIVATPTGSTAYSLSCGGPILTPDSGCFVITPIGVHTLTLRPMIVPDTARVRLEIAPGQPSFHVAIDSTTVIVPGSTKIELCKEDFTVRLVRMHEQSFFTAIHEKLSWGTGLR